MKTSIAPDRFAPGSCIPISYIKLMILTKSNTDNKGEKKYDD